MTIRASLVVSFGSDVDADGFLEAELDEELNEGKTSFGKTDTAFFLVYKSNNVTITKPVPSSGMVKGGNAVTRKVTEQLQFVSPDDTVSLSNVPDGAVTVTKWYRDTDLDLTVDGRTATIPNANYPAIADVEYNVSGLSYELLPPIIADDDNEWHILVVVSGEVST